MKEIKYIDSHVHIDIIAKNNPGKIDWVNETQCLPVSWAFGVGIGTVDDIILYLKEQSKIIHDLNNRDISCFYLTGIHPRNITNDLAPENIHDILIEYIDDPFCLGIGEIGLESGTKKEKEIFTAHLDLIEEVQRRGKVMGIHTPRDNKKQITQEIISILKDYEKWAENIVVDHCTIDTISMLMSEGYWAGITLSPIKTSFAELKKLITKYPEYINKTMLNTDSGSDFYEELSHLHLNKGISLDIIEKLILENAKRFFKL